MSKQAIICDSVYLLDYVYSRLCDTIINCMNMKEGMYFEIQK